MTDKIMACITNPVQCKLLLELYDRGRATAGQLAKALGDVPQATLYRHLKRMLEDGILTVVEQTPVRGTVEKTYALALDPESDFKQLLDENSGPLYMQVFWQYVLGFAKQFQKYCATPGIQIKEEQSGFSLAHLYLSDEELTGLVQQIAQLIRQAEKNEAAPGRRLRTLGLIVSPPEPPEQSE